MRVCTRQRACACNHGNSVLIGWRSGRMIVSCCRRPVGTAPRWLLPPGEDGGGEGAIESFHPTWFCQIGLWWRCLGFSVPSCATVSTQTKEPSVISLLSSVSIKPSNGVVVETAPTETMTLSRLESGDQDFLHPRKVTKQKISYQYLLKFA